MLKKNSWKLITIYKFKFITNMLSKKVTLWDGGAMVKDLILQCEDEKFEFPCYNLGYLGYLGDLIK
jgi:hypothetical protein